MRWNFLGGEIELPGPMYRELACPIAMTRETGGGDFCPGQKVTLFNISGAAVEFESSGLRFSDINETIKVPVFLPPGTDGIEAQAIQAFWFIEITSWGGAPSDAGSTIGYYARQTPEPGPKPARRPKRVTSSKPQASKNPLDAARAPRKLLN